MASEFSEAITDHWILDQMPLWYWLGLNPGIHLHFPWNLIAAGSISSALCWMTRVKLHSLGEDNL
jgi:hypothetical protein